MSARSPRRVFVVLCSALALSCTAIAAPITIDLASIPDPSGNGYVTNYYLTSPPGATYVDAATGVVLQGFYRPSGNANAWTTTGARLFIRNQPNDRGLGICHDEEGGNCGTGVGGGGQFSELDNGDGFEELLRLTLPAGYHWVGFGLSSLDDNENPAVAPERGHLWRSASGTPGQVVGTGIGDGTPFQFGFNGGSIEPDFLSPAGFQFSRYLFFEPYDWSGSGSIDNDYLLRTVTIERDDLPPLQTVPEPGTLGLIGVGLLLLRKVNRAVRG